MSELINNNLQISVLLVTVAIGEKHLEQYNKLFRKSHEKYAKKNNYDFKVVTDFLDNNGKKNIYTENRRSISFNKILVCSQPWSKNYDYIIFVDSDILININIAPALHNYCDYENRIGIVDEFSQPTPEQRIEWQKLKRCRDKSASQYYKVNGDFNIDTNIVINSGFMIFQPNIHANFAENIYNKYIAKTTNEKKGYRHCDQQYIGYELQINNMYKILPNKFNALWMIYRDMGYKDLEMFFCENYFIHFAGHCDLDKVCNLHKYIT